MNTYHQLLVKDEIASYTLWGLLEYERLLQYAWTSFNHSGVANEQAEKYVIVFYSENRCRNIIDSI